MEIFQITHHTYDGATLDQLKFPEIIANNCYHLSIQTNPDQTYLLLAKPLKQQLEKDQACGTLTLHSSGERGIKGHGSIEDCW
jgi:Tfp pilus assembly protein PilE